MSDWFGGSSALNVLENDLNDHLWFAVRTKSRCEKKIGIDLKKKKIRYYLPMISKVSKSGRMMVTRELPLFSGYIFVNVNYESKQVVEDHEHVASLISVTKVNNFLNELKNIEKALLCSHAITPVDHFEVGTRVRVKRGPMEGIVGEVLRFKNKFSLILRASVIGQAVSMEIDAGDTEAIVD